MEKQPEVMAREMGMTDAGLRDFQGGVAVVPLIPVAKLQAVMAWPYDKSHRVLVQTLPADAPPFPVEFSRPGVRAKTEFGANVVTIAPAYFNGLRWCVPTDVATYPVDRLTVIPPTPTDPIERMRDEHPDEAVRALAAEVLRLRKEVGR